MLDKHIIPLIKPGLQHMAVGTEKIGLTANRVSVLGFGFGVLSVVFIAIGQPLVGLIFLLLNRLADGIDGELARLSMPSDAGAFLDISLDFIFYALVPVGFAVADPSNNALPAAVLIASFVGTGATFLAYSTFASQHAIEHPKFAYKGLYYIDGLAEGTETILCFVLMCLLPSHFALLAYLFALVCAVTAVNRVAMGFLTLKNLQK